MLRKTRRICLLSAMTALGMLAVAAPALAHVTVSAPGATSGGSDQIITFRVPNESDDGALTTGLTLQLPTDTPIASVLVQPTPGWTFTETSSKLTTPITTDDGQITQAVSEIHWSATAGNGIAPEQFGEFILMAGQLPDASSITFKAIQTYSDGSTVSWTDVPAAGSSAEPDHPAPVLTLTAASSSTDASAASGTATATSHAATSGTVASATHDDSHATAAVVVAIIALVVACCALLLALLKSRRGDRSEGTTA